METRASRQSSRTVLPAGAVIQRLRVEKGWNVETMADKASCTPKTIMSVEASKPCLLSTIALIAQALGTSSKALFAVSTDTSDDPGPTPTAGKGRRVQICFTMAVEIGEFDECTDLIQLLEFLKKRFPDDDVDYSGVRDGSTIITLTVSEDTLMKLFRTDVAPDLPEEMNRLRITGFQAEYEMLVVCGHCKYLFHVPVLRQRSGPTFDQRSTVNTHCPTCGFLNELKV